MEDILNEELKCGVSFTITTKTINRCLRGFVVCVRVYVVDARFKNIFVNNDIGKCVKFSIKFQSCHTFEKAKKPFTEG